MSYHRCGVLPGMAARTVPVLPQAGGDDHLALYTVIHVGKFGEAKRPKSGQHTCMSTLDISVTNLRHST